MLRAEGAGPGITWLGQAGFWIDTGAHRVLIDPYLSDSLARKYPDRAADYARMMPPPADPATLPCPDIVLVTHAHTDHMDPDTLAPLAARFPDLPFVVPASALETARARIGATARLIGTDAGATLAPLSGLTVTVTPAAHETPARDSAGRHLFLGYAITAGGVTIWHSGDCIPFDGLAAPLRALAPDIALLPVNGRDAARLAAGVPGNFTLEEAIALCARHGIGWLIPHHFGMFPFNTCDPAAIDRAAATTATPRITRPVPGQRIAIGAEDGHGSHAQQRG